MDHSQDQHNQPSHYDHDSRFQDSHNTSDITANQPPNIPRASSHPPESSPQSPPSQSADPSSLFQPSRLDFLRGASNIRIHIDDIRRTGMGGRAIAIVAAHITQHRARAAGTEFLPGLSTTIATPRVAASQDGTRLVFLNPNDTISPFQETIATETLPFASTSPTSTFSAIRPFLCPPDIPGLIQHLIDTTHRLRPNSDEVHPDGTRVRVVRVHQPHKGYTRNSVRTTYFRWIGRVGTIPLFPVDFLPRNLYTQFTTRAANVYYLLIAILQFQPFSPYAPVNWIPLLVVLLVNMVKELYEDILRAKQDTIMNTLPAARLDPGPRRYPKHKQTNSTLSSICPFPISLCMKRNAQQTFDGKSGDRVLDLKSHSSSSGFELCYWEQLEVGDVVLVRDGEALPCDLVVLSSSGSHGAFYISTMDLDGETNLKARTALEDTDNIIKPHISVSPNTNTKQKKSKAPDASIHPNLIPFLRSITIRCDVPNQELYSFTGNLEFKPNILNPAESPKPQLISVSPTAIALRGSVLKNTQWILGVAVYCGPETKVYMNSSSKAPIKGTTMDTQQNKFVYVMFGVLFVLCILSAIFNTIIVFSRFNPSPWYFAGPAGEYDLPAVNLLVGIFQWLILLAVFIPISLTISIEMVRVAHKLFIEWDADMVSPGPNGAPVGALARTSNLSEELGRVEYVFSDKTGTLTCNVMELMKLGIYPGIEYGSGLTEIARLNLQERGIVVPPQRLPDGVVLEKGNAFYDERITPYESRIHQPNYDYIDRFFRVLMVCHTTMPRKEDSADPNTPQAISSPTTSPTISGTTTRLPKIRYESESPDENALVIGARSVGYVLLTRDQQTLHVSVDGRPETYQILNVNQFSSDRKRMSTVVRCPDGTLKLMCKGADSVILARLSETHPDNAWRARADGILARFSSQGLRTLCISERILEPKEYEQWAARYRAIITSSDPNRQAKLDDLADEIERELVLLGVTGIEDQLQEGVPRTIKTLIAANVKLWVLTGDHVETALSIAMACGLVRRDMYLVVVQLSKWLREQERPPGAGAEREYVRHSLQEGYTEALRVMGSREYPGGVALAIDGAGLKYALEMEKDMLRSTKDVAVWTAEYGPLLQLGMVCRTVLCCRVSPFQKADVVRAVRNKVKSRSEVPLWIRRWWPFPPPSGPTVTLAIGDGANDVEMIRAAHLGVGISGYEGRQAVNSADFAIGQFRFLARLLLVHGRLNCLRIATLINYSFYKNVAFALTNVWFGAMSAFSGAKFQEDNHAMIWNLIVTAVPILVHATLDKDVDPPELVFNIPELYMRGQKRLDFNGFSFTLWMLEAVIDSVILFFLPLFALEFISPTSADSNQGDTTGVWLPSWVSYFACVAVINLRLFFSTHYFTFWTWFFVFGSIGVFILFSIIYTFLPPDQIYSFAGVPELSHLFIDALASRAFILTCLICVITPLIIPFLFQFLENQFFPLLAQKIRERVYLEKQLYLSRKGVSSIMRHIGIWKFRPYSQEEMGHHLLSLDYSQPFSDSFGSRKPIGALPGTVIEETEPLSLTSGIKLLWNGVETAWRGFGFTQDRNNCPEVPMCVLNDTSPSIEHATAPFGGAGRAAAKTLPSPHGGPGGGGVRAPLSSRSPLHHSHTSTADSSVHSNFLPPRRQNLPNVISDSGYSPTFQYY